MGKNQILNEKFKNQSNIAQLQKDMRLQQYQKSFNKQESAEKINDTFEEPEDSQYQ